MAPRRVKMVSWGDLRCCEERCGGVRKDVGRGREGVVMKEGEQECSLRSSVPSGDMKPFFFAGPFDREKGTGERDGVGNGEDPEMKRLLRNSVFVCFFYIAHHGNRFVVNSGLFSPEAPSFSFNYNLSHLVSYTQCACVPLCLFLT
jgi:hypothetical protein